MTRTRHLKTFLGIASAALITVLPSRTSAQADPTNVERNRQFIAQAFERWSKGGSTFFQDVLAPDAVWTIKGTSPAAGTYHSRQDFLDRAVKPFADRMATPVRPSVNDVWADGNHVIVYWDGVGTAGDGEPYRNSYVWIFRMVNRRAAEVVAFLDLVPYDAVINRVPASKPAEGSR